MPPDLGCTHSISAGALCLWILTMTAGPICCWSMGIWTRNHDGSFIARIGDWRFMERWPRLSGGQQYERDAELVGEPGAHAQSLDRHSHNWDKVQSRRHRSTDHLESGS